jgi:hypothetical protein
MQRIGNVSQTSFSQGSLKEVVVVVVIIIIIIIIIVDVVVVVVMNVNRCRTPGFCPVKTQS